MAFGMATAVERSAYRYGVARFDHKAQGACNGSCASDMASRLVMSDNVSLNKGFAEFLRQNTDRLGVLWRKTDGEERISCGTLSAIFLNLCRGF